MNHPRLACFFDEGDPSTGVLVAVHEAVVGYLVSAAVADAAGDCHDTRAGKVPKEIGVSVARIPARRHDGRPHAIDNESPISTLEIEVEADIEKALACLLLGWPLVDELNSSSDVPG